MRCKKTINLGIFHGFAQNKYSKPFHIKSNIQQVINFNQLLIFKIAVTTLYDTAAEKFQFRV